MRLFFKGRFADVGLIKTCHIAELSKEAKNDAKPVEEKKHQEQKDQGDREKESEKEEKEEEKIKTEL